MTKKKSNGIMEKPYIVKVWGESESDWRAAMPKDIQPLIYSASKKDFAKVQFKLIMAEVELLINEGEIEKAAEALQSWIDKTHDGYSAPKCCWKRDLQNRNRIFQGAHCFFGAFRDAADYVFPKYFFQSGKKGQSGIPSKKHLRKVVHVKPYHVFFYRMDGAPIFEPDEEEGQQPIGEVKGFAYYEIIQHPFKFDFQLWVNPSTKQFADFLKDSNKVLEALHQAAWHGQAGCRGVGYGQWKITKTEIASLD